MESEVKNLDITKSGPLTYRELQTANQESLTGLSPEYQEHIKNIEANFAPTSLFDAREHSEQLVQSSLADSATPWGESMFDESTATEAQFQKLGDIRADNQPGIVQIGSGVAKGALLAGTTFIDGTVGLLYGGFKAIQEQRFSAIWDNDFMRATKALNEAAENALPNYYTEEELNSPWYTNILTSNWLGDKLIKNMGFTVGAFMTGNLVSSGIHAVGRLAFSTAKALNASISTLKTVASVTDNSAAILGSVIATVNEGRAEAINNATDEFYKPYEEEFTRNHQKNLEALRKEFEANKGKSFSKVGSEEEGNVEFVDNAYIKYQDAVAKERANYEASIAHLKETMQYMGNVDLALNVPILMASNLFQFAKYWSNGFKTARKTMNITGPVGAWKSGRSKLGVAGAFAKGFFSEGTEEITQKMASEISGDYYGTDVSNFYRAQYDEDAAQDTLDWVKSFATGICRTAGDINSWEEFFIGGVTGFLGMPVFTRGSSGKIKMSWQGGGIIEAKDYINNWNKEKEVAEHMNNRFNDPKFKNYWQGLVRHNKFQGEMDKAVLENDEFSFKNAEFEQAVSDILLFDKAGKLESLKEAINSISGTSVENLEAVVANTTAKTADGKLVGPFAQYAALDNDGNIIPNIGTAESQKAIADKLNANKKAIFDTIDKYQKYKDMILSLPNSSNFSDDQTAELIWMSAQLENWSDRATEMASETKAYIKKLIAFNSTIIETLSQLRDKEDSAHVERTELYDKYDTAYNSRLKFQKTLENLLSKSDEELGQLFSNTSNKKFIEGLISDISGLNSKYLNPMEKNSVTQKLKDYIKIGLASDTFHKKLMEYMKNPEAQVAEHARIDNERLQQEKEKQIADLETQLTLSDYADFRNTLDNYADAEIKDATLKKLADSGNQMAKHYIENSSYYNNVRNKILNSNIDDATKQDALALLSNLYENSETLEQLANPASTYISNSDFFEETSADANIAQKRFLEAQYEVQKALSQVNSDEAFKSRFTDDYRKAPEKVDSVQQTETNTVEEQTSDDDITPVGDITDEEIIEENAAINDSISSQQQPKKGEVRRYYKPSIPELHIARSKGKDGDFRAFDIVEKEVSGLDFSDVYKYLEDAGAFEYLNSGKLKAGDKVKFMIDPAFEEATKDKPWHTTPTIFIVTEDGKQVLGVLDSGNSDSFEGLTALRKKIIDEYTQTRNISKAEKENLNRNEPQEDDLKFTIRLENGSGNSKIFGRSEKGIEDHRDYSRVGARDSQGKKRTEPLNGADIYDLPGGVSSIVFSSPKLGNSRGQNGFTITTWRRLTKTEKEKIKEYLESAEFDAVLKEGTEDWYKSVLKKIDDIMHEEDLSEPTNSDNSINDKTNLSDKPFIASPTTKVSKMMVGKVPHYKSTENKNTNLKDIYNPASTKEGEAKPKTPPKPVFAIVRKRKLITNGAVDENEIVSIEDFSNKEGRLYLLIPNGAGMYSPVAIRVKHFNISEFNVTDPNSADSTSPIGKAIISVLNKIVSVQNSKELNEAVNELIEYIYLGHMQKSERDVNFNWYSDDSGTGIIISRKVRDSDGFYVHVNINNKQHIKEERTKIVFTEKASDGTVTETGATQRYNKILETLLSFNLPMQVSIKNINKEKYNNSLINSGILYSNIPNAESKGTWFTMDYFDNDGNIHDAENPPSIIRKPTPKNENPVSGTESAVTGTKITLLGINQTFYVDTKKNIITNEKGQPVPITPVNRVLFDLAWAQENFGDKTYSSVMIDNKVLTPGGRVLDRTTQKYLPDNEADEIKKKLKGTQSTESSEDRIALANKTIDSINENQKAVDKSRTDSEHYWILEEDGEYHAYDRVHKVIGSNRHLSEAQLRQLDNISRELEGLKTVEAYDEYVTKLANKYLVNLTKYKGRIDKENKEGIIAAIKEGMMSSKHGNRALEAGNSVDSITRQFFMGVEVAKIQKPSNMSQKAFDDLITTLTEIKSRIELAGERFLTNNIVLYHKYADGTRVAGEVDILAIDKNGNFKIYDLKTSSYARGFGDWFDSKSEMQSMTTREYYTLQLSSYKNLFESQYGLPITNLAIMPFVLDFADDDSIRGIIRLGGIHITYNPNTPVRVEGRVKDPAPIAPAPTTANTNASSTPTAAPTTTTTTESKPVTPVNNPAASTSDTNTANKPAALFDSTLELQNPEEVLSDDSKIDSTCEVGYFELAGKIHKGYLKPIGTRNGNTIYLTRIPNLRGLESEGDEKPCGYYYYIVLPNGKTINPFTGWLNATENVNINEIMSLINNTPNERFNELSKSKTLLYDPASEIKKPVDDKPVTPANIHQEENQKDVNAVNNKLEDSEEFDDDDITSSDDDPIARLRDKTTDEYKIWDKDRETEWLSRVLPQLSTEERLQFVEGLIKVANSGGGAWGMFSRGIITLSDIAAEGTLYHEAFHAVFHLLMSPSEREGLLSEYRSKHPNMDDIGLEEELAEDFREFVMQGGKDTRSLGRKILDFFKSLFMKIVHWDEFTPSSIYYFRAINEGKYAGKALSDTSANRSRQEVYTQEMMDILNNAPRDSEGHLLAPNGKPTNLTERQYVHVRTKAFKEWFGDWENNPEEASKVVDENGEPLVVYHGSDSYGFNVFDPSKSDDKISLFATDSKYIASTYTKHQPIHSPLVKNALLKAGAIELIKNKDWKALQTVINNIVDTSLPGRESNSYFAPWGNSKENIETLNKIRKELNNSDLTENEINSLLQQLSDAEDRFYFSGNYKFTVTSRKSLKGEETIIISIDDSYRKEVDSGYFTEGGVIFRGSPERLIDSLTYDTKIYDLFLNIKNPLILENQKNEFGAALNWNRINFTEAFHIEKDRDLWGEELLGGNHRETHTRDVARYAKNHNYDGVIFRQIVDHGGNFGDPELSPATDASIAYAETHIGEDSYNGNDIYKSDIFISFNSNQIKSATDNIGTYSSENADIRYRMADSPEERLFKQEAQRFLKNFGITIKEYDEYDDSEMPLFDALNRVINVRNANDLSEGMGYAIAFMMQYNKKVMELIGLHKRGVNSLSLKAVRRSIKKRGEFEMGLTKNDIKSLDRQTILKEIGKDIAFELRKLYNLETTDTSNKYIKTVWDAITAFFDLLTPKFRTTLDVISHNLSSIANAVKLNDTSIIRNTDYKPGTHTKASRVNIGQALKENPYEDNIIRILQSYNIALAGSASIALSGRLLRPVENPLHDIDFNAAGHTRKSLDEMLEKEFKHFIHTNRIDNGEDGITETYLIMDREFTVEKPEGSAYYILKDTKGNKIGAYIKSNLTLEEGVQGKFLDFFTGASRYGKHTQRINGRDYLISDARNALYAKVTWARNKDIWDYNNYVDNETLEELEKETTERDKALKEKFSKARVIWGHPALGKTTYLERNDDILEWDSLINKKRDEFIRDQIDPQHTMDTASSEYRKLRSKYMMDWKEHPEYVKFLTDNWNALLAKAKRENKRVFASPVALLEIGRKDIDLIIAVDDKTFRQRDVKRGNNEMSSRGWKQAIDRELTTQDQSKIFYTADYLSDFMRKQVGVSWGTLTEEEAEALESRGWSKEMFNSISQKERENAVKCMAF